MSTCTLWCYIWIEFDELMNYNSDKSHNRMDDEKGEKKEKTTAFIFHEISLA